MNMVSQLYLARPDLVTRPSIMRSIGLNGDIKPVQPRSAYQAPARAASNLPRPSAEQPGTLPNPQVGVALASVSFPLSSRCRIHRQTLLVGIDLLTQLRYQRIVLVAIVILRMVTECKDACTIQLYRGGQKAPLACLLDGS